MHKCDNPNCINPNHLILGSHFENMLDRTAKDRNPKGERNGAAKLTEQQVILIRQDNRLGTIIAKEYNISKSTISSIKLNKIWKYLVVNDTG